MPRRLQEVSRYEIRAFNRLCHVGLEAFAEFDDQDELMPTILPFIRDEGPVFWFMGQDRFYRIFILKAVACATGTSAPRVSIREKARGWPSESPGVGLMAEERISYGFPLPEGEVCPTGSFSLFLETGLSTWSEGLFRIHGYTRGEVVPTAELVVAHKHPEDRDATRQLINTLARDGGQGSNFHRIIDSQGKEHRVLTVAEADRDEAGKVISIHGLTIDLTRAIAIESGHAATSALVNAYASRGVIEQAKGILMGYFNIRPAEAFERISQVSQNTNTKVTVVAAGLVAAAEEGRIHAVLRRWTRPATSANAAARPPQ